MQIKFFAIITFLSCWVFSFAQPSISAPTPTHSAADVVVLFSDFYTTTLKPEPQGWGGSVVSIVAITTNANDNVLKSSGGSNAIYTSKWSAQKKGYVHVDVYPVTWGKFQFYLGTSFSNIYTSLPSYNWPTLQGGVWTSIDVPIVEFVKAGLDDAVNVQGIKFSGTGIYYVDNIYAWGDKEAYTELVDIPVAPTPIHDANTVKSVFSNTYTASVKGVTPQTFGGTLAKIMPYKTANEQSVLRLQRLGTSLCTIDTWNINDKDYIHLDVYWDSKTTESYTGALSFGMNSADWSGNNIKKLTEYNWPTIVANKWVGIDIPISNFKTAGLNTQAISQIQFIGSGNFYVDNLYAFSGIKAPTSHPTTVPSIVLDEAYYQVKSIFCEQYEPSDYQETLGISDRDASGILMDYGQNVNQTPELVEIENGSGNKSIYLSNWNDYPFKIHKNNESMDLSDMDYLHVSVYQTGDLDVNNKPATLTFWMHDKDNNGVTADIPFVQMKQGEWVSISIPLCYFKEKLDLSKVSVLRLHVGGYEAMAGYVDNIFAYKGNSFGAVPLDCGEVEEPKEAIADKTAGELPPRDRAYLGVNLASASGGTVPGIFGVNYAMPKLEDLWYFKAKGVQFIRFPFRWKRLQAIVNGPLTQSDITEMKSVVAEAERLGIWVMLDMHDYCERTENDRFYEIGVSKHKELTTLGTWTDWITDSAPELTADHFADGWKKIATEFKDFKNIWGYDLMNEPKSIDISILKGNYQTAINAIREVDSEAYIVVEGKNYANAQNWESNSGLLKDLVDPTGKDIIYQAHAYFDNNCSGTYTHTYDALSSKTLYKTRIDPFIKWLKDNNKRGFLGEYGVPYNGATNSDPRYMDMMDSVFTYLKNNQLSNTYWCGGSFYESNALTVQPAKDYFTEKSTMKVMEKYTRNFHVLETGLNNLIQENAKVSVYPNPVANELIVEAENGISSITVINLLGQTLIDENKNGIDKRCLIDFSHIETGSYLLQVKLQNGISTVKKIVK